MGFKIEKPCDRRWFNEIKKGTPLYKLFIESSAPPVNDDSDPGNMEE